MEIINVAKVILASPGNKKLLLIRRSSSDVRRPGQWDIPGGWANGNETIEAAAIRECQEETAILLDVADLRLIYSDRQLFAADKRLVNWLIFAAPCDNTSVSLSDEHDSYRWVSITEACSLLTYDRYRLALQLFNDYQLISELI